MICYLVTGGHTYTINTYLRSWGDELAPRIAIVSYESLAHSNEIPVAATYIFSDIERLTFARQAVAVRLWNRLRRNIPSARLLNHPTRTLRRFDLLRYLHETGTNDFKVRRCRQSMDDLAFPVFVRVANDHDGSRTELLTRPEEARRAIRRLRFQGWPASELLVTEFCDTADVDGVYRKYSAFVIDGSIIPRHLIFGHGWMLKNPEISDDWLAEEQRRYVETNPHESVLRQICKDANVDYGRIDYGLRDGRVQVWEINTNPMIMQDRSTYKDRNIATHRLFAQRIESALESLDAYGEGGTLPVDLGLHVRAARVAEKFADWLVYRKRSTMARLWSAASRWMRTNGETARRS